MPSRHQPGHDSCLVAEPPHQLAGRDGQQKIAQVEPDLNSSRARTVNVERLHELPDQNVVQVVRNRPQKEQHRHHQKRQQPPVRESAELPAPHRAVALPHYSSNQRRFPICPLPFFWPVLAAQIWPFAAPRKRFHSSAQSIWPAIVPTFLSNSPPGWQIGPSASREPEMLERFRKEIISPNRQTSPGSC